VLREGYGLADFRHDLGAGLVVGIVALPLAMALAIGVGVPPQHGLYTAIVAGFLVAALGGSRMQVTGPTAAFIVILAPIYTQFGLRGLLLSGVLAGLMLVAMGVARLGALIQFIPHPVTTGFTAGIGTVIAVLQLKDVFGLTLATQPVHFHERLLAMVAARATVNWWEFAIAAGTLALLLTLPRLTRKVPAPLLALPLAALAGWAIAHWVPGVEIATIASRFETVVGGTVVRGIPPLPPMPLLPWTQEGAGSGAIDFALLRALLPGAFAIAMLGAIESLLSAVVADGMARTRHDPDAELLALGIGNIVTPFFGGIPATGAIARTATNVRSGARSPIAAMLHAVVILAAVLLLAPALGWLPMSALAALLLLVAWHMAEAKLFVHIVRVAPRSDVVVLLTCFGLTVAFDMVVGVAVGMVLAAFLFMRRMAEVTRASLVSDTHPAVPGALPAGVAVYEISGPLFFGAAQKALATFDIVAGKAQAVVLLLEEVHAMDSTGLVALETALAPLRRAQCLTILTGVQEQPLRVLQRAGVTEASCIRLAADVREAVAVAAAHVASHAASRSATPTGGPAVSA
jgi:SulP family sulfate permease